MATITINNLPEDIYHFLKQNAEKNKRDIQEEIILLLKKIVNEKKNYQITQLRGLGKEIWKNIDVEDFIKKEREKW